MRCASEMILLNEDEVCVLEQNRTTAFTFQLIIFVPYRLPRSCYSDTVRTVQLKCIVISEDEPPILSKHWQICLFDAYRKPSMCKHLLINYYRVSGKNGWAFMILTQMWLVAHQLFISWFLKNLHSHSV